APPHLGDELPPFGLGIQVRHASRGRMDDGTDGRALLQGTTLRGAPQGAVAFHRIASRDRREEAVREGALTAEKRPVRKTDRVRANNDAVCSPEGIRTPDLFLEREAPWTTRRPGRRNPVYASHSIILP